MNALKKENKDIVILEDVDKAYRRASEEVFALKNINLKVKKGEFLLLEGPSGSGKTTLLSLIGGLTGPTDGTVFFDNIHLASLNDFEISKMRRDRIGFIFQFPSLVPFLSVYDNVLLPAVIAGKEKKEMTSKVYGLLELLDIKNKSKRYPYELSAGEQRRTAVARAFINKPSVILADEPVADLDEYSANLVKELLFGFNKREKTTIILVTHLKQDIKGIDREIKIYNGSLKS